MPALQGSGMRQHSSRPAPPWRRRAACLLHYLMENSGVASLLPHLTATCRIGISSDAQLYYMTDFSQASLCVETQVRTKHLNYQCSP